MSVDATIRGAEAAEHANITAAAGSGLSLLALVAAWLAFRETRRAANAAERQAEEAVKSANAALQSIEDGRKFARQQLEAQATASRSNLVLESAHLTVKPDIVAVQLEFGADGMQDIWDLRVDLVPVFEDGADGSLIKATPPFPEIGGDGLTIKGNDHIIFTGQALIDRDAVRELLQQSWQQAMIHIRAQWRDTMGFVIDEYFIAYGPVHASQLSCDLDIAFQKKRVTYSESI